jgi:FtsP/CotA-like multicopper oxidase with cupredoxin domain
VRAQVPRQHPRGVFYYHPHLHGSSALQAQSGMAGAIVVAEPAAVAAAARAQDLATAAAAAAAAAGDGGGARGAMAAAAAAAADGGLNLLVVQQFNSGASGTVRNLRWASAAAGSAPLGAGVLGAEPVDGVALTVNGVAQPCGALRVGAWVRLRVVHAGFNDLLLLSLRAAPTAPAPAPTLTTTTTPTPRPRGGAEGANAEAGGDAGAAAEARAAAGAGDGAQQRRRRRRRRADGRAAERDGGESVDGGGGVRARAARARATAAAAALALSAVARPLAEEVDDATLRALASLDHAAAARAAAAAAAARAGGSHAAADAADAADAVRGGATPAMATPAAGCELAVLARDGVELRAPRAHARVLLAPGSRADLAVRCASPGVFELVTGDADADADADAARRRPGLRGADLAATRAHIGVDSDVAVAVVLRLAALSGAARGAGRGTPAALAVKSGRPRRGAPEPPVRAQERQPPAPLSLSSAASAPAAGIYDQRELRELALPPAAVWRVSMLQGAIPVLRPRGGGAGAGDAGGASEGPSRAEPARGARSVSTFNSGSTLNSGAGFNYTWYGMGRGEYDGLVARTVALGAVEEWRLLNRRTLSAAEPLPPARALGGDDGGDGDGDGGGAVASVNHPFHLHVNHFQIAAVAHGADAAGGGGGDASADYDVGDWRDTVTLPAPGALAVRWAADDYVGRAMAHCHIFGHSDTGMSLDFAVVPPPA